MKHIGSQLRSVVQKTRDTERGELLKYFCSQLNPSRINDGLKPISIARMGFMLTKVPTKDLYYIKRICDDAQHFSKKFWWLLKTEKHTK